MNTVRDVPDDEIFSGWVHVWIFQLLTKLFVIISGSDRNFLAQYVVKIVEGEGRGKYRCSICGKVNGQKVHTENHVESIHFPGTFEYPCKHCSQTFSGRNKLYMHVNAVHSKQQTQHQLSN